MSRLKPFPVVQATVEQLDLVMTFLDETHTSIQSKLLAGKEHEVDFQEFFNSVDEKRVDHKALIDLARSVLNSLQKVPSSKAKKDKAN